MAKVRSDIARLFGAVSANDVVSYREFTRDVFGRPEGASAPVPVPPPAEAPASDGQVESLTQEDLKERVIQSVPVTPCKQGTVHVETAGIPSSDIGEFASPGARQDPGEMAGNPPDSSRFSMLHFLSNKTRTSEAIAKPERRIPRVAIYSPLGGSGCSTVAAGLAWLLAKNDQSPLIADLGGTGKARLFFGMQGEDLESDASWSLTAGSLSDGARPVGLVSASRREAAAMAVTVLSWVDGAACPRELAPIFDIMRRPDWVVFDVASARIDLLDTLITQVDMLVVPLRVGLETILAVEEMQREVKAAKLAKNGNSPQCLYVLNQFEAENPLHLEIARMLRQDFGALVATQPIPRDPGLSQAIAENKPFSSSLFVDHLDGFLSLLLRCSLTSLSAINA